MRTVVFFIGSLQLGGTEAKLARNFLPILKARGKINPKLLLLQERGEFLQIIPDEIEKYYLQETSNTKVLGILPKYREALKQLKADIVISCMWYPAIISYISRKIGLVDFKHIVHDTVNMTEYVKDYFACEKYKWLKIFLTKKAYCDAENIIVVSEGEKEDLIKNFNIPEKKIYAIYNPINIKQISEFSLEDTNLKIDKPLVVSAGRLVHQKGFDILLKAFRKVRNNIASKLLIMGDGEKKEELISLSNSLNLQEDIIFLGMHKNPFKFMREATVFCLASRYEGLGNAIIEAMALGLPVIAADCPSGPGEILDNGRYGILVPPENPDALADAIIKILTDRELKENLSNLSLKRVQDFSLEKSKSLKQWEDLILSI